MARHIITSLQSGLEGGRLKDNTRHGFSPLKPYTTYTHEQKISDSKIYPNLAPITDLPVYSQVSMGNIFEDQRTQWSGLQDVLSGKRNGNLIAFDFETLGVRNSLTPDKAAITEFGITIDNISGGRSVNTTSFSVAFGIDETMASQYLEDLTLLSKQGTNGINAKELTKSQLKAERSSIVSTAERLSRYSGPLDELLKNTNDLFETGSPSRAITLINNLAPSTSSNIDAAMSGLLNLSAMGGISQDKMSSILQKAGFSSYSRQYADVLQQFSSGGYHVQTQDSSLMSDMKKFIVSQSKANDSFVAGYNIAKFDIPLFNQGLKPGNQLKSSNTIDLYAGYMAYAQGSQIEIAEQIAKANGGNANFAKKGTEEGLAHALGLSFADTAHNAGSDTAVVNQILLSENFGNGQNLVDNVLASDTRIYNPFSGNTVGLATKAIEYDKNSPDLLQINGEVANEYQVTGVRRGRFYTIDGIQHAKDGDGVLVKFSAASDKRDEIFYKHYDSIDDAYDSLRRTFEFHEASYYGGEKTRQKLFNRYDLISDADLARRNYDSMFEFNSVENLGKGNFSGGYDRLNQYYQAYKVSSEQIGSGSAKTIEAIAAGEYDDVLVSAMTESGFSHVSPSQLRDFRSFYGKLKDESKMLDYLDRKFSEEGFQNLDNYQRTMIASQVHDKIISSASTGDGNITEMLQTGIPSKRYSDAMLQDVYAFKIDSGDISTVVNFENAEGATSTLYNAAMKSARNNGGNETVIATQRLGQIVQDLSDNGILSDDFLQSFTKSVSETSASNYQPWLYAQWIANGVQTQYVNPMKAQGWGVDSLKKLSTYKGDMEDYAAIASHLGIQDIDGFSASSLAEITANKLDVYSGSYVTKARGTVFERIGDESRNRTFNQIFSRTKNIDSIFDEIASNVGTFSHQMTYGGTTTNDVAKIKQLTRDLMGYDEETANEVGRMLSLKKDRGTTPFGLLTYGDKDKADFVTTFFHSGEEGANGFLLVNKANDTGIGRIVEELNSLSGDDYAKAIRQIGEDGRAAVFELPAIHEMKGAFDGFTFYDAAGNAGEYSFKTIDYGDKGFQKVIRQRTNTYRQNNSDALSDLVIAQTDDAFEINKFYTVQHNSIMDTFANDTLSTAEQYQRITANARRYRNRIIQDDKMPGLSGMQVLRGEDGIFRKVNLPNKADLLQSSKIDITSLQDLYLKTISKNDDIEMANFVAQFYSGSRLDKYKNELTNMQIATKMANGEGLSSEFKEAFSKHLFALNIEDAGYVGNGNMPTGNIISYLQNAASKGQYHEKTTDFVSMLYQNYTHGNISQITKEHDTENMFISLINNQYFMPNSEMESVIRPVSVQQLTAQSYIVDDMKKQLSPDAVERLGITFGFDADSIQDAMLYKNIRDVEIDGITRSGKNITYGDLAQGISGNWRNISSAEGIDIINRAKTTFGSDSAGDFIEMSKRISRFGVGNGQLTQSANDELMYEAFKVIEQNAAYNVYESKGFLNPILANTSYFTAPNLRGFNLNGTVENQRQLEMLAGMLTENGQGISISRGTNLSQMFKNTFGEDLSAVNALGKQVDIIYNGEKGFIQGNAEEIAGMISSGRMYISEITQGMQDAKVIIGNEKMTARVLEKTGHAYDDIISVLGRYGIQGEQAQNVAVEYAGMAFEKIFGSNISGVVNLPLDKHLNTYATNYFNQIMYFANQEMANGSDVAYAQITNLFDLAAKQTIFENKFGSDFKGLNVLYQDGKWHYDASRLNESGVVRQIEHAVDLIQSSDNAFLQKIANNLKEFDEQQIMRSTLVLGINQETMGEELALNPRMGVVMRTKGKEFGTNYGEQIYDAILNEASSDKFVKAKYDSSRRTVDGLVYSTQNMFDPSASAHKTNILELNLDDVVLSPGASEGVDAIHEYSIFKTVNQKGEVEYSKLLLDKAKQSGQNLNDITAIKVNLPVAYDLGDKKGLTSILMPLYDVTPHEGKVELTKSAYAMQRVLKTAQSFNQNGWETSQKRLNSAVAEMYAQFADDLTTNKHSYLIKKSNLDMKGSGMFFAQHSKVPVVQGMVDDYQRWLSDASYRRSIISEVRKGSASPITAMAEDAFTGRNYSRVISNGKKQFRVYDDIAELSREGFERLGVNFENTGREIAEDIAKGTGKYSSFAGMMNPKYNLQQAVQSMARTKEGYEQLAEQYLKEVGTFGLAIRYPTFMEGSIQTSIFRLNSTLSRDEQTLTPLLANKLNADYDGDKIVTKLFFSDLDNGVLLNAGESTNGLYNALMGDYKQKIELKPKSTGEQFANMLQDISDDIVKNGGREADLVSALGGQNVYPISKQLQKLLSTSDKEAIIAELQQESGLVQLESVSDLDNLLEAGKFNKKQAKTIQRIFDIQQRDSGNYVKSTYLQAAAIKARATKGEIGYISNPNYHINEALDTAFERLGTAVKDKNLSKQASSQAKESLKKLTSIKALLHQENLGFLPITEQSSIDVKHVTAGLSISETSKYTQGIKQIFSGDYKQGYGNLYDALINNKSLKIGKTFGSKQDFVSQIMETSIDGFKGNQTGQMFRALKDLSEILTPLEQHRIIGNLDSRISDLNQAAKFIESANKMALSGDLYNSRTSQGLLFDSINDAIATFRRGFNDRNGIFHDLNTEEVFFQTVKDGEFIKPKAFLYEGFKKNDDGTFDIMFKRFPNKNGSINRTETDAMNAMFKGKTSVEIQTLLEENFGEFSPMTLTQYGRSIDDKARGMTKQWDTGVANANARNYLDIKSRRALEGKTFSIDDYLDSVKRHGASGLEETEELLKNIDLVIGNKSKATFVDFRDGLRYINSSIDKAKRVNLEDALQDINTQIINAAKSKTTSTSAKGIYMSYLERLGGESLIKDVMSKNLRYQDALKANMPDFANFWSQFDSQRVDIADIQSRINKAMNGRTTEELQSKAKEIMDFYKGINKEIALRGRQAGAMATDLGQIKEFFNWNSKKAGKWRVGFTGDENGNYIGRTFDSLTADEIDNLLSYTTTQTDSLTKYASDETLKRLTEYRKRTKFNTNPLTGYSEKIQQDVSTIAQMANDMNEQIIQEGAEAGERAAIREAEKEMEQAASEQISKGSLINTKVLGEAWDKTKSFVSEHRSGLGKAALAIGAIGLLGKLMESHNDSPLSPELNSSPKTMGIGHGSPKSAPKTPLGSSTIYANPSDGLNYRMSAKSKSKINNTQAFKNLPISGSTDININDDRKPVNENWLQNKFAEYV